VFRNSLANTRRITDFTAANHFGLIYHIHVTLVHPKKHKPQNNSQNKIHPQTMSAAPSEEITLKYWGGRGLMEVPRLMMAIAGKKYNDVRVTGTADAGNTLDANLGRVPICECPEGCIGQSGAINYYIATQCGLMGSTPFEAAQILSFIEHIAELKKAYYDVIPYGTEPTEEALNIFFDSNEATDFEGPADGAKRPQRKLKWYMGRMERLVGDGFAVGGKLSLADVMLYSLLGEHLPEEGHESMPAYKREPLSSMARVNAALAAHPRVNACVQAVANNENAKNWWATRGPQGF
jgi:glutathione S-transferase